ncbi:hypothetical protein JW978_00575 [Candidatus Dojkabacteria bacterium]|nr:hypothetical protein [Candidatus Dojkabacteria bacterium]
MKNEQVALKQKRLQEVLSKPDASARLVTFIETLIKINEREKLVKNN